MDAPSNIPNDENGDVIRRMIKNDDDLSKPRLIDFCHVFSERRQALAFAEMIDDRQLEVCISYYEKRDLWDVKVKRYMIPTHHEITAFEKSLAVQAELLGGEADGWGCMTVTKKPPGK